MLVYKKVIEYCEKNNISVFAFEKKCGLANGTVSGWKNGGNPALTTLQKIVAATGVSIEQWTDESEVR